MITNTIGHEMRESSECARLSCYLEDKSIRYQAIIFEMNGKVKRTEFYGIKDRTIFHKHTVKGSCDEVKILNRLKSLYL